MGTVLLLGVRERGEGGVKGEGIGFGRRGVGCFGGVELEIQARFDVGDPGFAP